MKAKKDVKKAKRSAKRAPKDLAPRTRVAGGAGTLTNIANLKHEQLKAIASNLRG